MMAVRDLGSHLSPAFMQHRTNQLDLKMAIPFQCLFFNHPLRLNFKTIYREKYVLIVNMPSQPLLFVHIGSGHEEENT